MNRGSGNNLSVVIDSGIFIAGQITSVCKVEKCFLMIARKLESCFIAFDSLVIFPVCFLKPGDLVLVLGAGNINRIAQPLLEAIQGR